MDRRITGGTPLHLYGMRLRGFGPLCQPMEGLVGQRNGDGKYWDYLVYDRRLTRKEMEAYALDYIGKTL